jgi:WhiB family redox-sensing transcriptional regulator
VTGFLDGAVNARLRPTLDAWSWQRRGRCQDYPIEMFFPEDESRLGLRRREERAKLICRQCPVLDACREHALRTPERYGVWGAMSAGERVRTGRSRSGRERPEHRGGG